MDAEHREMVITNLKCLWVDGCEDFRLSLLNEVKRELEEHDLDWSVLDLTKNDYYAMRKKCLALYRAKSKWEKASHNLDMGAFNQMTSALKMAGKKIGDIYVTQEEHDDLLRAIANLHRDIEDLQFPVTTWTYDWWLRLPLKRIEEQHGKNLPFVGSYQRFLARRLPQLSFKKGNVHSDLHRDNVCFLTSGELRFIDWDQAHIDAAAIDFIRPSALYFEVTEDEAILSSDHINELQSIVSPLVENINELDLRFLLVRSLLVHDDIRTSRESARMFLEKIKRFVAE